MPLPASITTITITGTYLQPDQTTPCTGTVSFRLSAPATDPTDNIIYPQVETTARLNAQGSLSVPFPATDDPQLTPSGLMCLVTERIDGALARDYYIAVPAASAGGTLDLADVTPAIPGPVLTQYIQTALLGVAGGVATLDGSGKLPSAQLPALSYVLASQLGAANGVATLDSGGKLTASQLPAAGYVLSSSLGVASGVATLDGSAKLEIGQLPNHATRHAPGGADPIRYPRVNIKDLATIAGDGTTDDTAGIQAAINAAIAGNYALWIPRATYKLTDKLDITGAIDIASDGATLNQTVASKDVFRITVSDVRIAGLKLTGPGGGSSDGAIPKAFSVIGASTGSRISRIAIERCQISGFRYYGIYCYFADEVRVIRNRIDDIWYAGVMLLSCDDFIVDGNRISNINATAPAYGIAAARFESGTTLTTDPRCRDGRITNNRVTGVTNWEGIDTHSGQRLVIAGNVVRACRTGILVGPSREATLSTYDYAPIDVDVIGNIVDSDTLADGAGLYGISFTGADDSGERATGSIVGNIVRRCGDDTNNVVGALYIHTTDGLAVTGNWIYRPSPIGISFYKTNRGFTCTGNTIIDPWSDGTAISPAVACRSNNNTGTIGNNSFVRGDLTGKTHMLEQGIRIDGTTGMGIRLGSNYSDATTYISDANTDKVSYGMLGLSRAYSAANTPESAITAPVGSIYLRTNGGAGTTLYVKESGSGNTGWVGK